MKLIVTTCFLCVVFSGFSQQNRQTHAIGIELFGKSDIYCISAQKNFTKNNFFRIGIGYQPGSFEILSPNDRSFFYVPVETGKAISNKKHKPVISVALLNNFTYYHTQYLHFKTNPRCGAGYMICLPKNYFIRVDLNINLPLYLAAGPSEIYVFSNNRFFLWPGIMLKKYI